MSAMTYVPTVQQPVSYIVRICPKRLPVMTRSTQRFSTMVTPRPRITTRKVDHLGTLMPLLSELRLERGSTLASFRDLGSSLSNLRVVWLSACGIRHLDGVGALTGLEELYLAFNDVEDLTSIALHERLEVFLRALDCGTRETRK